MRQVFEVVIYDHQKDINKLDMQKAILKAFDMCLCDVSEWTTPRRFDEVIP